MSAHHFITLRKFFWLAQNNTEDFQEHFENPLIHIHALEHGDIELLEEYPDFVQCLLDYETAIQNEPYPVPEDYTFSLENKLTNITTSGKIP